MQKGCITLHVTTELQHLSFCHVATRNSDKLKFHLYLSLPKWRRLIVFALFLLIIILLPAFISLLFLSAKILSGVDLCNHWTDCSEIWGNGRYGCEVVQDGFKIQTVRLKAGPPACPKHH